MYPTMIQSQTSGISQYSAQAEDDSKNSRNNSRGKNNTQSTRTRGRSQHTTQKRAQYNAPPQSRTAKTREPQHFHHTGSDMPKGLLSLPRKNDSHRRTRSAAGPQLDDPSVCYINTIYIYIYYLAFLMFAIFCNFCNFCNFCIWVF